MDLFMDLAKNAESAAPLLVIIGPQMYPTPTPDLDSVFRDLVNLTLTLELICRADFHLLE